jgi:sporulation protein YlmC with PRC-barrel domain
MDARPEDGKSKMIAAELRGGSKPSLNEALGWIGSRVDDIYGASVGRLEDVWIDPGTGTPRWLLVKEGRFGGRTTLIPFEDATAGAGHVWVPYERDVVRDAPEIEPGAPLTQAVETELRAHYASRSPSAVSHRAHAAQPAAPRDPEPGSAMGAATIRFGGGPSQPEPPEPFAQRRAEHPSSPDPQDPARRPMPREEPPAAVPSTPHPASPPPSLPQRPAPPIAASQVGYVPPTPPPQQQRPEPPPPDPYRYAPPPPPQQPDLGPYDYAPPRYQPPPQQQQVGEGFGYPRQQQPQRSAPYEYVPRAQPQQQPWQPSPPPWSQPPDPAQGAIDALRGLAAAGGTHFVEIELSGELSIRGELRSIRVTPRDGGQSQR